MGKESKKVSFYTLGCKLNFAETATISRKFTDDGYQKVEFGDPADVIVINTCSVTQLADKKCRQAISKAARNSPNAIVTVIGCYSQLKPEEISHIEGVDIVLGTKEKFDVLDYVREYEQQGATQTIVHSCEIDKAEAFNPSFSMFERTRSFLKVQDGCDYNCSYCTIPLARGMSRNTTIEKTIAEARKIAGHGIKEIVLTGVNIGDFGKSTDETFTELVRQLDEVEGIERFRISSIEPNLLTNEIIAFVAQSKRFVPHFHIPLQSGCNEILGLMKRRYTRELFENRIKAIKAIMPDACIGADVIVGFPGESDERFNDTYTFIESLPVSYLHVFSYSERKDTKAILLPQKVNPRLKELRSQKLIQLSEKKRNLFYQQHMGKTAQVLFESEQTEGMMHGFTSNYIKVEAPFDNRKINQTIDIKLQQIMPSGDVAVEYV